MTPDFTLPLLPNLPPPEAAMDWRYLHRFRSSERGAPFYVACLQYGQWLWLQRLPARAILCLDRAWGADLSGSEPELLQWPLPYFALAAILKSAPEGAFIGNPRVHFQHYADRLGEPRRDQRRWRSWAGWAIACRARPDLPGDPRHEVVEPSLSQIFDSLERHGHPGEARLWQSVLDSV